MKKELENLKSKALAKLKSVKSLEELDKIEQKYFGRKDGELNKILRGLKDLPAREKPLIGPLANRTKKDLEQAIKAARNKFTRDALNKELKKDFFDITAPGTPHETGHIHVLAQTQYEVERIFNQMGFAIQDGPEIES
ncbi:phenylalanine--tRNA ligase subunit alpha, partial [Patescibacteria group bacterium]|nr:phenylalanine--tRNA ligase subunit alpha [Patescibacteria group bacterium]